MSVTTLIELFPRDPGGNPVALRFSHKARPSVRFFGIDWRPAIISLPDFELDLGFDGQRFGQGATPQVGQLVLATDRSESWHSLIWPGAAGNLRTAPWPTGFSNPSDGAFGTPQLFRVTDFAITEGEARLVLADVGDPLRRPAIVRKFGSTGSPLLDGAGTLDRRGQVVPTGWGRLRSVPGILVDRVNNIWLFLDRPSSSIQGFFDGGAAFTMGAARASLAELQANAPAAGAVDYCLDAGGLTLARPWTDPTYPFTADLTVVGPSTAAGIAQALVTARTAIGLQAGTVAGFDALYPAVCGLYIDDERPIATALDQLIMRLGGWWRLTLGNELAFGRLATAAPVKTFGRTEVMSIARQSIVMPTRRRSVGYGRNNRVHNEGEIASILLAEDIAYADGTPIEALKPEGAGATRNVDRGAWVSAAIGTSYIVGDEVQDQGSTWGCFLAHSKTALNGPPTLPTASNSTWRLRSAKGDSGANSAIVFIYQRATSAPAAPSVDATYTFATGGLTGLNNGWSATIPTGTNPIYVRQATASAAAATDTIAPADWSAAQVLAQNGAAGAAGSKTAVVFIYQRAGSAPAAPSATATFTFASGGLTGLNNGWSPTIPTANGQPLWVRTAIASGTGTTDTIATGEWTGAQILAENGADGAGSFPIYTRSATQPATPAASSGVPAGWYAATGDVPAGGSPMWVSIGTRPNSGANWTWPVPTRHEAISAVSVGQSVPLDTAMSDILGWVLQPGESRVVRAQAFCDGPVGSGSIFIQLETREATGGWSVSNSPSAFYNIGEPTFRFWEVTVTNSSAVARQYEARAILVDDNGLSGGVTPATSFVSI